MSAPRSRSILLPVPVAGLLACALLILAGGGRAEGVGDLAMPADSVVGSCTPELVHQVFPGTIDASGSGVGNVAELRYTDAAGVPRPPHHCNGPLVGPGDRQCTEPRSGRRATDRRRP
jgi:hypothetical protein